MWNSILILAFVACAQSPDVAVPTWSSTSSGGGNNGGMLDPDEDRLNNNEETTWGTDPNLWDTDGDGYADGDEVTEGTDPLDPNSKIYAGGWPYYYAKDSLNDPDTSVEPTAGTMIPRFAFRDQFGDMVELYDFAYAGVPIVIHVDALWNPPGNDLGAYLIGNNDYWSNTHPDLPEMIENGDVHWITILAQDYSGPATNDTPVIWHDLYPHEHIPVLADKKEEFPEWIDLIYYPTTLLVGDDLVIEALDTEDPYLGMDTLQEIYGY